MRSSVVFITICRDGTRPKKHKTTSFPPAKLGTLGGAAWRIWGNETGRLEEMAVDLQRTKDKFHRLTTLPHPIPVTFILCPQRPCHMRNYFWEGSLRGPPGTHFYWSPRDVVSPGNSFAAAAAACRTCHAWILDLAVIHRSAHSNVFSTKTVDTPRPSVSWTLDTNMYVISLAHPFVNDPGCIESLQPRTAEYAADVSSLGCSSRLAVHLPGLPRRMIDDRYLSHENDKIVVRLKS